jgi:hypothetical protein
LDVDGGLKNTFLYYYMRNVLWFSIILDFFALNMTDCKQMELQSLADCSVLLVTELFYGFNDGLNVFFISNYKCVTFYWQACFHIVDYSNYTIYIYIYIYIVTILCVTIVNTERHAK